MTISIQSFDLSYHSYQLYDVTFFGKTIKTLVTDTPCIVDTWISDMRHLHRHRHRHRHCPHHRNLVVGLDIEWRPNRDLDTTNPAATLQLCIGRNCLIFQLIFAPKIPRSLWNFLSDDDYIFVGVGIDADVEKLYHDYMLEVSNTVDLRGLAARNLGKRKLRNAGLGWLASEILGKEFEKPKRVTLSDWAAAWLTDDQIQYACVDAFVSYKLGRSLNAGNLAK